MQIKLSLNKSYDKIEMIQLYRSEIFIKNIK